MWRLRTVVGDGRGAGRRHAHGDRGRLGRGCGRCRRHVASVDGWIARRLVGRTRWTPAATHVCPSRCRPRPLLVRLVAARLRALLLSVPLVDRRSSRPRPTTLQRAVSDAGRRERQVARPRRLSSPAAATRAGRLGVDVRARQYGARGSPGDRRRNHGISTVDVLSANQAAPGSQLQNILQAAHLVDSRFEIVGDAGPLGACPRPTLAPRRATSSRSSSPWPRALPPISSPTGDSSSRRSLAEAQPTPWWTSVFQSLDAKGIHVAFVPCFLDLAANEAAFAAMTHTYGLSLWGTATPSSTAEAGHADVACHGACDRRHLHDAGAVPSSIARRTSSTGRQATARGAPQRVEQRHLREARTGSRS